MSRLKLSEEELNKLKKFIASEVLLQGKYLDESNIFNNLKNRE